MPPNATEMAFLQPMQFKDEGRNLFGLAIYNVHPGRMRLIILIADSDSADRGEKKDGPIRERKQHQNVKLYFYFIN